MRTSSSETGTRTPSVHSSGIACSQPRALSEPLSQMLALAASSIRALTSSHDVIAIRVAPSPMPIRTRRCPSMPRRQDRA